MRPLVLDFDASVLPLAPDEIRLPLEPWQEAVRFGCSRAGFERFAAYLEPMLPREYSCAFYGSGDYHHLSLLLARFAAARRLDPGEGFTLVVLDNHPDNMRYLFGLHCGSWVRLAALLPGVRHVHVVGITSGDVSPAHAWENYLRPFALGRLTYWSVGVKAPWLKLLGRPELGRSFADPEALAAALVPELAGAGPIYLSIDKDVFLPEVVRTNWDQGRFTLALAGEIIRGLKPRVFASDVCGEASYYAYQGRLKRLLSRLDGQDRRPDSGQLAAWQETHRQVNLRLLDMLGP